MIECVQDDVELWLKQVCKQVDIEQVQLEYHSALDADRYQDLSQISDHQVAARREVKQRSRPIAWESPIRKGPHFLGKLCVRIDDRQPLHPNFIDACQLADTFSQMAADYGELKESLQLKLQQEDSAGINAQLQQVNVLVEQALESSIKLTGYRGAAFFLLDEKEATLQLKHYCHQNLAELPGSQRTLKNAEYDRKAFLNNASSCWKDSTDSKLWLPQDVSTGLCFKVATSSGVVGTVWFFDRRARVVDDRDYHVLQSIAAQLGTILDHAVSIRQNANHRRMKTELRLASATQPAKSVKYVSPGNDIECFGCCLSQYDVGGDLCELIPLSDKHLFVVVGDASGNSIPAAMVMTAVRGAAYALVAEMTQGIASKTAGESLINPAKFMGNLNRMLVNLTDAYQFMSCICGLFDLEEMTFSFCNAGHPSPIHLSEGGLEYLPSHGLLLGIDKSIQYDQGKISLDAGDVLVLYTDGVSEAMNQQTRQLFRQDGIAAAAQLSQGKNAESIFDSIWDQMQIHSAGVHESDDATALVIKLQNEASNSRMS